MAAGPDGGADRLLSLVHLKNGLSQLRNLYRDIERQTAWMMVCGAIPWAIVEPGRARVMAAYALMGALHLYIRYRRPTKIRGAVLGAAGMTCLFLLPWNLVFPMEPMPFHEQVLRILLEVVTFGVAAALVVLARSGVTRRRSRGTEAPPR